MLFILAGVLLSCREPESPNPPSNPGIQNYDMHYVGDLEMENVIAIRGAHENILVVSENGGIQFHVFEKGQMSNDFLELKSAFTNPEGVHYSFGNHYTISNDGIAACSDEGQLLVADFGGNSIYTRNDKFYRLAYVEGSLALAFASDQSLNLFSLQQNLTLLQVIPTNKVIQAITFFQNRFIVFFNNGYGVIDVSNLNNVQFVVKGNVDFKDIQFVIPTEDYIDIEGSSKYSGYRRISRVTLDANNDFQYVSNNEMLSGNHIAFSSSGNKFYIYREQSDLQVLKNEEGSIESYRIFPLYDTPQWKIEDSCSIFVYQDVVYTISEDQSAIRVFRLGD